MQDAVKFEFIDSPEFFFNFWFSTDIYIVDCTIRSLHSGVSGSNRTARDLVEIGVPEARKSQRLPPPRGTGRARRCAFPPYSNPSCRS